MAKLIECPTCKKRVSVEAESCPKCGQPFTQQIRDEAIKKEKSDGVKGCLLLTVIFIGVGIWFFGKTSPRPNRHRWQWHQPRHNPRQCRHSPNLNPWNRKRRNPNNSLLRM